MHLIALELLAHLRVFNGGPSQLAVASFLDHACHDSCGIFYSTESGYHRGKIVAQSQYEDDILVAARLKTRIRGVTQNGTWLQDDRPLTIRLSMQLVQRNSSDGRAQEEKEYCDALSTDEGRRGIDAYLDASISRNREILTYLSGLRTGALAPLRLSPVLAALLVPVSAGGLSVIEYLLRAFQ